jgi:SAM-dependent methyltransferase
MPPVDLIARIGGSEELYHAIGRGHAQWILDSLPAGWTWEGKRVLDFGCGTGRTIAHLGEQAPDAEFWGCDIYAPSIDWARNNLSPPYTFVLNEEQPPTELEGGSFDLVYGMSVFTHLVDGWVPWLLEMHRLLRTGGYGVFSFLGEGMVEDIVGRPLPQHRIGMIGLDVGRPWALGGANVLHSEWWLRAHWGRAFEIVSVLPYPDEANRHGHGRVLLRKDERPAPTPEELLALEADEPREIAALQLNLELAHERTARLWAERS